MKMIPPLSPKSPDDTGERLSLTSFLDDIFPDEGEGPRVPLAIAGGEIAEPENAMPKPKLPDPVIFESRLPPAIAIRIRRIAKETARYAFVSVRDPKDVTILGLIINGRNQLAVPEVPAVLLEGHWPLLLDTVFKGQEVTLLARNEGSRTIEFRADLGCSRTVFSKTPSVPPPPRPVLHLIKGGKKT